MEKICKNCKYWDNNIDFHKKHGSCENEKFIYIGNYDVKESEALAADTLIYEDFEGYKARVFTGENFGCIHWKEKV